MKKKQIVMLKKYINDAKKCFFEYDSLEDKVKAYDTYCTLLDYYEVVTGINVCNQLEEYVSDEMKNLHQSLTNHALEDLVKYKEYHKRITKSSVLKLDSVLQEVADSSYLSSVDTDSYYRLSKEENRENWELFFQYLDKHKELKDLYFKICRNHNCYFSRDEAHSFFAVDYLLEQYLLLIGKGNSSLDTVVDIVHELGHASEYQYDVDINHVFGKLEFMQENLFSEVMSSYFEQEFLEYYLKHTSQKVEGVLKAMDFFDNCEGKLYMIFSASSLDDESIYQLEGKDSFVDDKKIVEDIDVDCFDRRFVYEDSAILYGYGFLISSYLLEHPEKIDCFLEMRREEFSPQLLEELGIREDNVCDIIDSRCQKVFGKYL